MVRPPPRSEGDLDPRRWRILSVIVLGQFVIIAALGSMNVALPAIKADLSASEAGLQWTIVVYGLAYSMTLITGGRLGDLYGRRLLFQIGVLAFVVSSAVAAAAPSIGVLIAARLTQGVAGGMASPQVMAMIRVVFPAHERARAFSVFSVVTGSAFMFGQIFTGAVLEFDPLSLGWRATFVVNALVGLVTLAGAVLVLPAQPAAGSRTIDVGGVVLLSASVVLLLFPIIQGRALGWPPALAAMPALGVLSFRWFLRHERAVAERGGEPLVDLTVLQVRSYRTGIGMHLAFASIGMAPWLLVTIALQTGFGFDAFETALATGLASIFTIAASALTPMLTRRLGTHVFTLAGIVAVASTVVIVGQAIVMQQTLTPMTLLPGFSLMGFSHGLILAPAATLAMSEVRAHHAGAASGLLQTSMQLGSAVALALYTIVYFEVLDGRSGKAAHVQALSWGLGLRLAGSLALIAFALALPRRVRLARVTEVAAEPA